MFCSGAGIVHPIHLLSHELEILEETFLPESICFAKGLCDLPNLDSGFSAPVIELAKRKTRKVLKNVLIVPAFGAAVLGLNTDNPGVWLVHCHFNEDVDSG